jgi:plastocyanin
VVSRRLLLGGAAGGLGLVLPGALLARAQYDDYDDRDEDKDRDDDRDNSGPGGGGDDHDHDDDARGDDDAAECDDDGALKDDDDACVLPPNEVHIVDDDDNGFLPGTLEVPVGQAVTFFNDDDEPHTATGSDWDTGVIEPGAEATITFDTAGTYNYACLIHPVMTGTIVVGGGATPAASPEASPAASPVASPAADGAVDILNFAFDPPTITVPAGTTVTWTNRDEVPHTATGDDGSFDTDTIDGGGSASHTFDSPGTFPYVCVFHPNMEGTVVVT